MSRDALRAMKRTLRIGRRSQAGDLRHAPAVEAALSLLERSVRMRHRRLAVQRLNEAVAIGARVPDAHWQYCRETAAASRNSELQQLFMQCARGYNAYE
ncbi:MAG: hypothetical protein KGL18_10170 [Burkholderiales bacterium]|nr:hypothetical protein [Burkholderiales bacterium]